MTRDQQRMLQVRGWQVVQPYERMPKNDRASLPFWLRNPIEQLAVLLRELETPS